MASPSDLLDDAFVNPALDHDPVETNYVMITGENTIGGLPNAQVGFRDITDGTSNTIAVVEVSDAGFHWMEPVDLTINDIAAGINNPTAPSISSYHPGVANACFADGSVHFLAETMPPGILPLMITINDGQPIPMY